MKFNSVNFKADIIFGLNKINFSISLSIIESSSFFMVINLVKIFLNISTIISINFSPSTVFEY